VNKTVREMLLVCTLLTFVSACSLEKDTKDMKKTTEDMKKSTDEMKKSTDEMKKSTDELKVTTLHMDETEDSIANSTSVLLHDAMMLGTDDKLNNYLNVLYGNSDSDKKDHGNSDEIADMKAAEGAIGAMYFQRWTGSGDTKTLVDLDVMFYLHLKTLLGRVHDHKPFEPNYNPAISPDAFWIGDASLGAFLDFQMDDYTAALEQHDLKNFSLYDVMVESLRNRAKTKRTERLKQAAKAILYFQPESIYLMQLRHNYLPMMVVGEMTKFQKDNLFGRLWDMLFGMSQSITLPTAGDDGNSKNVVQLARWSIFLKGALQTRLDLTAMGINPVYNNQFAVAVGAVNFNQDQILAQPLSTLSDEGQRALHDFTQLYTQVQQQSTEATLPMAHPNYK
jgi:hypothetical protein